MDTLFLHADHQGNAVAWAREAGSVRLLGTDSLEALAARHAGARVVLFIPSSQCLLTRVTLSVRQRKQLGDSLAWLIEEQVGEDVEGLHVIAGSGDDAGITPVLAIAVDVLESWRTRCREAGWALHALLPDILLLDCPGDAWHLACRDGDVALRTGLLSGAALESVPALTLLQAAWQELAEGGVRPARLIVSGGDAHANSRQSVADWAGNVDVSVEWRDETGEAAVLASRPDWSREPGNFLQGRFASRKEVLLPASLRIAALFLAVAFGVQLLSDWGRYFYYQHQARKVHTEATALYKQLFPGDRRIVSLRRQMEAHLEQGAASGGALPLLTRIAEAVQGSGLATQRVDYSGGVFTLDVEARGLTDIDALKQRLVGSGLRAEIVSANAQGSAIRGRLRVESGA